MGNSRTALVLVVMLCGSCGKSSPNKQGPVPDDPGARKSDAGASAVPPDSAAAAAPRVKLRLQLSYTSGEHSKDSHAVNYTCAIEDDQVTYSGPYGACERGQCEHKVATFQISNEQATALLAEIDRLGLFKSFEEVRETSLLGHFSDLTLRVAGESSSGAIRITGMNTAWGKDKSQNLSDEAALLVSRAESLRGNILELVKPHMPDAH